MKAACLIAGALLLVTHPGRVARAEPIAITGASVVVKPGTRIEKATVVIDKGKIVDVGTAAKVPAGARVIDGTGKVVTAGFIESSSTLGLIGVDGEASSVDGRFDAIDAVHADPVHASFEARDGYNAHAVTVPVARAGGITTVVVTPIGGLVSGQSAVFALDGSGEAVRAPAAMHAALGADAGKAAGGSRGKSIAMVRELLDDARAYGKDRAGYERNAKRKLLADRLDLEALQRVLAGQIPLVVVADSEADIRAALRIAAQYKLRLVIASGAEAWRVAPELAKAKVPVLVDPTANLPADLDANDVHDDAATLLDKAGVQIGLSTLGGSWNARTLRQLAGNAVGHGMPWDRALAGVTTVPATTFGLVGRGTLDKGSIADVVVWSGDPFETTSVAEQVIIGGALQSLTSHQSRLLERYRKLPLVR